MTFAVIMAGGVGARFWPLSRRNKPKQLLKIVDNKPLITATMDRLLPLIPYPMVKIVTTNELVNPIRSILPALQIENFITEPSAKNTAPCIGLAAVHVAKQDPNAVMVILPSDHRIEKEDLFRQILSDAVIKAEQGTSIVTIGINPTRPETGYGYIQYKKPKIESLNVFEVKTFAEKPDKQMAQRFIESGDFLWNAGIFVVRVDFLLELFQKHLPSFYQDLHIYSNTIGTKSEEKARVALFNNTKPISFDYAIMEHTKNVQVIPADIGWSDVGSWNEIKRLAVEDANGNAISGDGLAVHSKNCYVQSTSQFTAIVGLENVVVITTPDAILVCHADKAQEIRDVVTTLDLRNRTELL